MVARTQAGRTVARNAKARFDYEILETYEAGIVLTGTEVKSLRSAKVSLEDSFARISNGELFLYGCHIPPYKCGNIHNHDPMRNRKLLMRKREIARLAGKLVQKGLTLVPLSIYFNRRNVAKVQLGLARGRRKYDKRQVIRKREHQRQISAFISSRKPR